MGNTGSYSVGIFNPLRVSFHNRFELQAQPLLFFVAPHLDARFAILKPPVVERASCPWACGSPRRPGCSCPPSACG